MALGRSPVDTRPAATDWTPKYSFGVPGPNPLQAGPDTTGRPWEPAPPSSHVHSWRFFRGDESFRRKFLEGVSELHVRFRGAHGVGIAAEYVYYWEFTRINDAIFAYDSIKLASHPYMDVVKSILIDGKIPYRRLWSIK